MPTEQKSKGGRSLGHLFGHTKRILGTSKGTLLPSASDVSLAGEEASQEGGGVTREDIVWDPQGRILNWKSVVSKIQIQVCGIL